METLLLPGLDGTGRLFDGLLPHLSPRTNVRVVSFPPDSKLGYEDLAERIEIPSQPFAIVAESFSGPLAVMLAQRHPARIRALVLVATFLKNPSRWATWLALRVLKGVPPTWALRCALLGLDAPLAEVATLRSTVASVDPKVLRDRLTTIARVDVTREFQASHARTLYIAGQRDRLVGRSSVALMKKLRPDMEVAELDAPHLVLQRKPKEAAALISEFILRS